MSGSDNDSVDLTRTSSPVYHRKKHSMDSSRSPRSSKHHHSRSRSRSRDRKRDRKYRRSRSRSKEARRRDSEKPPKSNRKTDEQLEHDRLSAENGEERSRRKDRRPSKGRSFSRSHSRERQHHSKSKDKRRSRSRSRDRKKKARSRSGSRSKHRHHSRSRSKSRERKKRSEKVRRKSRSRSVNPPAFRGRNTAMDAQEALARRLERAKKLQEQKEKEMLDKQQQQQQEIAAVAAPIAAVAAAAAAATSNPALNVAALLASGTQVTPQIAMAAQMAALQAKTLAETGIAVPSYYNPSAVNPMKFAEQEKKRKMLWQGKKEGDKSQTAELWEKLNFGNKNQNVKFRKLMGIKGEDEAEAAKPLNEEGLKTLQKQEEMFRNLDVQYEMARSQTHTQRGMGLGFTSSFSRGMDSM
ncbi:arginine/serine-rich coiled-coil protein 2 isoform X1 [Plectropomus leopardus]|uniref:arginine/serine-rich coiled-coil protein 2 isoform X1 n=1 Tax=Plectropomus leopardus TaxID=160734 RepID=UPI001C4C9A86|nr:arginine/serine-rich coiled-coil protein 2 isoform X1 [Plectropomus leopardus]